MRTLFTILLMRTLFTIILLCAFSSRLLGVVEVDYYIGLTNGVDGDVITATTIGAGTIPSTSGHWADSSGGNFTVGSHSNNLPALIAVGGVNVAADYLNHSLRIPASTTGKSVFLDRTFGPKTTVACWMYVDADPVNSGASYYDIIYVQGISGTASVCQIRSGTNGGQAYGIWIESTYGGTHHSPLITLTPHAWYWVSLHTDFTAGTNVISIYDASLSLIGSATNTTTASGESARYINFGQGEYGTSVARTNIIEHVLIAVSNNAVQPLGFESSPIIPSSRMVAWSTNIVGIPGGIPTTRTNYTTIVAGASLATVQAAINACPSNGIVQLSAGLYDWSASANGVQLNKSGVTLRGAGMDSTIIVTACGTTSVGGVCLVADDSGVKDSSYGKIIPLWSGYSKGSTNLILATNDVASLYVGYHVVVDQLNDNLLVNNSGNQWCPGVRTDTTPELDGLRALNQTVEIRSISNGTNITIWPPLNWTYTNTLSPQVYFRPATSTSRNYLIYSGLESLTVSNLNSTGYNIWVNRAGYCWIKDVKTRDAGDYHMAINNAYCCEFRRNVCMGTLNTLRAHGYGIGLNNQCVGNIIEDNIIANNREFVQVNAGSEGNVVAYNYMTNAIAASDVPSYAVHAGAQHSAHTMMNLWEGNITYEWASDFSHGSHSHATLLRNWFRGAWAYPYAHQRGTALTLETTNSYFNIVGNIFGVQGMTTNANWTSMYSLRISPQTNVYNNQYTTFRVGYYCDNDTGDANSCDASCNAQKLDGSQFWTNHIVAGNYDYVAGSQVWYNPTNAQTIPDSYYYASKPSWWGNCPWPPFNPADVSSINDTNIPAGARYAVLSVTGAPPVVTTNAVLPWTR